MSENESVNECACVNEVAIISSQSVYEQNMSIFKLKESKISTSHLIVLDQAISLMWVAKLNEPPFSAPGVL